VAIEFAVNSTSKRGRRTGFCGPVVVSFDAELEAMVGNLAQRLRRKFRVGFEPDRTQFKRDGLANFRRNLPPRRARVAMLACSDARLPTSGKEDNLD